MATHVKWSPDELRAVAMQFGEREKEGKPVGEDELRRVLDYSMAGLSTERRRSLSSKSKVYALAVQLREEHAKALVEQAKALEDAANNAHAERAVRAAPPPSPATFVQTLTPRQNPGHFPKRIQAIVTDAAPVRPPVEAPVSAIVEAKLRAMLPELSASVASAVTADFMAEAYPMLVAEVTSQVAGQIAEFMAQVATQLKELHPHRGALVEVSTDVGGQALGFQTPKKKRVLVLGAENKHHRPIQDKLGGFEVVTSKTYPSSLARYDLVVVLTSFTDKDTRRRIFHNRGETPVVPVAGEVTGTVAAVRAHFSEGANSH